MSINCNYASLLGNTYSVFDFIVAIEKLTRETCCGVSGEALVHEELHDQHSDPASIVSKKYNKIKIILNIRIPKFVEVLSNAANS
jgi:hypothetical protein